MLTTVFASAFGMQLYGRFSKDVQMETLTASSAFDYGSERLWDSINRGVRLF